MRTAAAASHLRATSFLVLLAMVLLTVLRATGAAAEETGQNKLCNPLGLLACEGDLKTGQISPKCCDSLISMEPCLCFFLKDPTVKKIARIIFEQLLPEICGLRSVISEDSCA